MRRFGNRRGAALETAIFMLVVVFALCTVIVVVSLMIRARNEKGNIRIAEEAALDGYGEAFVAAVKRGEAADFAGAFASEHPDYEAEVSTSTAPPETGAPEDPDPVSETEWLLRLSKDGRVALVVGVGGEDGRILRWHHFE